jgi:DNA-directed RNA polymerase specialized sigma24 family protein
MEAMTVTRLRRRVDSVPAAAPARVRSRAGARRRPARPAPAAVADRTRLAAALARRGARTRLILALLLYERLRSAEVADALRVSPRQVERTYETLLAELRRSFARAASRTRSRAAASQSRLRRAA